MATKKPKAPEKGDITIQDSHFNYTNNTAANEHTRAAIEALSRASERHAEALIAIANALKGGDVNGGHCIYLHDIKGGA
jgi:hypothetical protein